MSFNKKKEILFRKNRGKQLKCTYIKKINSILINSDSLNLLELEETDIIRKESYEATSVFIEKTIEGSNENIQNLLKELKDLYSNYSFYVYIDDDWKYCGAFFIESLANIKSDFCFNLVKDDIVFLNERLFIAIDYYSLNGKYFIDYTIRVMGNG